MRYQTALHQSVNFSPWWGYIVLLLTYVKEVAKSVATEMLISSQKYDQS